MQYLKIFLIIFILCPYLSISQENKSKNYKTDANSGSTNYYNKEKITKGYIKGRVKQSENNKNLEFATISLVDFTSNKLIEGTITDNKGKFTLNNINIGKYKIKISFIGFKDSTIIIETTKAKPNIKIKDILLKINTTVLSEINIEEKKLIYETRIDKIIYNAENDLNDSENDATDVLRKTPLVTVDIENNVSLRGSRNIKFLVNGKASTFFSSDVNTALQMIPADEIKSIEVITSPGAKYDGDGDAGIINIITKKKRIDGYKASIRSNIGSRTLSFNTNLKLGKNKSGISVRGGSFGSGFSKRQGNDTYERIDWNQNGDTNILYKEGISENQFNGYRGSISAYHDINSNNTLNSSFSFSGRTKPNNSNETIFYTPYQSITDTIINSVEKTDRTLKIEWTTDYIKKFPNREGKELSLALQIGGNINDGNTNIYENNISIFNQNDEKVIEKTFQIDYTYPFGKLKENNNYINNSKDKKYYKRKSKITNQNNIEIGAKIINRNREIIYSDIQASNYIMSNEFIYNQLVTASYISTQIKLPLKLGLKTGVRHEYTNSEGNELNNNFITHYNNWLPSITLSKSFSPIRSVKLSYNQRITRPSVRQINTNTNRIDNRNITIGNPYLEPTQIEQYELSINNFNKILQTSIQLYYKHSYNSVESFLDTISNETSISTYKNIGESKQNGISFFGGITLKRINLRGGFNVYNYSGRDINLGYNDWTKPVILYSYNFNFNFDITKRWKAESFAFFRSPNQTIQGSSTSFSMMSVGIKKEFKNKRGSLGLRIIEPFNENKIFTSKLNDEFFTQETIKTIPFRSFAISFKYTIGKLNFKEVKSNINNNDIQKNTENQY